jgi:uncharacterized protein with HEPN domain
VKDPRVFLAHILECIGRIESYVAKGKEAFFAATLIQDAIIRNFEVIGEAAKRIPDSYRQENPTIPWRNLAAFRDVLIHQYEGVSLPRVWEVIERDLPSLKAAIASLLPPLDQLERELNGET